MARKKAVKVLRKQKKRENMQRFTQKQNIGRACLTAKEFRLLQRMSHSSKALRNVGLYTIKQSYLNNNKMATVKEVDTAMQTDMNYWGIQSNSVQAIRRALFTAFLKHWNSGRKNLKHSQVVLSFRITLVQLTNESLKSIKFQKWMITGIG
ncbi:Mobile element protein [Bacillus cereus]|nr:Mobile element protein [Bacillus cereus]